MLSWSLLFLILFCLGSINLTDRRWHRDLQLHNDIRIQTKQSSDRCLWWTSILRLSTARQTKNAWESWIITKSFAGPCLFIISCRIQNTAWKANKNFWENINCVWHQGSSWMRLRKRRYVPAQPVKTVHEAFSWLTKHWTHVSFHCPLPLMASQWHNDYATMIKKKNYNLLKSIPTSKSSETNCSFFPKPQWQHKLWWLGEGSKTELTDCYRTEEKKEWERGMWGGWDG